LEGSEVSCCNPLKKIDRRLSIAPMMDRNDLFNSLIYSIAYNIDR